MKKRHQHIKKKRTTSHKLKSRIGTIVMVVGIGFIMYGFKDSIESWVLRSGVENTVNATLKDAVGDAKGSTVETTSWELTTQEHEPVKNRQENTHEYESKGALIIPKIQKTLAIMDGVGGNNMSRGASEQYVDQEMGVGNYVLSSHRIYDGSLFGRLEEVEIGDTVYITNYKTVWKYEVVDSDNHVETTRTQLLQDTEDPVLTMYGCTADGEMRVVKRAKLVGSASIEDLSEEDAQLLNVK